MKIKSSFHPLCRVLPIHGDSLEPVLVFLVIEQSTEEKTFVFNSYVRSHPPQPQFQRRNILWIQLAYFNFLL